MSQRQRIFLTMLLVGLAMIVTSASGQARGEVVTVRYTLISPIIALLAGILILIIPRLLNYIVAVYLILIGLIGVFGR